VPQTTNQPADVDIAERARWLGCWLEVRGMLTLVFGLMFLERRRDGIGMLAAILAVYCFFDAAAAFAEALSGAAMSGRVAVAIEPAISLAAGVIAAAQPGYTVIVIVVGARAILLGLLELISAACCRRSIRRSSLLVLSAALSIVFGVVLLARSQAGPSSPALLVGVYGFVLGVAELVAGIGAERRAH
jgi:uncharacterized membrane protein HdeD (DUF308 family)